MKYEKFDDVAAKKIKFYVYALVDPRTNKVFYVGKGKKNRWYDHIDSANKPKPKEDLSLKLSTIAEIHKSGNKVGVHLIRHGIASETVAYEIEAAVIHAYRLMGKVDVDLTNIAEVHNPEHGLMGVGLAQSIYNAMPAPKIVEPVVILKISQNWYPDMPAEELMETTTGWWQYRKVQENAKYAFAVSSGVIREVYRIKSWRERREGDRGYKRSDRSKPRWGFPDGCEVAPEMSHYLNKSVKHLFKTGDQTVNKFINCGV
jgi:hypothetical protein